RPGREHAHLGRDSLDLGGLAFELTGQTLACDPVDDQSLGDDQSAVCHSPTVGLPDRAARPEGSRPSVPTSQGRENGPSDARAAVQSIVTQGSRYGSLLLGGGPKEPGEWASASCHSPHS